jgi:DNA helicase-2/ATP-dependent DNA helicase PcrA
VSRDRYIDFNSLILLAHGLFTEFPAIAPRYRRSHPFWLVDEFQDLPDAQYRLLRAMAGEQFKDIFPVSHDDQSIKRLMALVFDKYSATALTMKPR